ncbi:MAG: biotin/lipoyl-binding protein, partial [Phycisphaerae bacterium]
MKMKQYYKTGLKLLAAVIIVCLIVYYLFFAPVSVETLKVISGPVVAEVMGTGTLEARVRTTISPKISGRIAQIFVDQGDKVVKGQKLLTLD